MKQDGERERDRGRFTENLRSTQMDLDDTTVYTNETGKHSTLTPLYAILQAKDHEPEMRHPQEAMIDQCKWLKQEIFNRSSQSC